MNRKMRERSEQLYKMSCERMPGGVNSPVRAFYAVGGNPVFMERARGCRITDIDGNTYIDYVGSWGPAILGHADDRVIRAVQEACERGLSFGAPTIGEYELAELIHTYMPSMEQLRLVSSGTEAVMSAIRVARGYTGRTKIVKFRGCYHGHSDGLLVKAGSGALTQSVPDSGGVPMDYTRHTLVAEYNDLESVNRIFQANPEEIAAVIVEPVAANMGVILPEEGFLEGLRQVTEQYGALLIFDEVITGFRLGLGGAQEYYGVIPDLTTLGKIVGGGMPLAAYGGRKDIMQVVAPVGAVYQAGTLSGNPVAVAAGLTTLRILAELAADGFYERLSQMTQQLARTALSYAGDQVCVNQIGSLMSIFFTRQRVRDYESACTADTEAYSRFFMYMLNHGFYLAPSQFEAMFLSGAHGREELEETCRCISEYDFGRTE